MVQTALLAAAAPLPGLLSNPLYAAVTAAFLVVFGVLFKTKFNQPIISILCIVPAVYIGYVLFTIFGN